MKVTWYGTVPVLVPVRKSHIFLMTVLTCSTGTVMYSTVLVSVGKMVNDEKF